MHKAVHPLGGVDSSNPCRLMGKWLHHHGGDDFCVFVLCVAVSCHCNLSYVKYQNVTLRYAYCLTISLIGITFWLTHACTTPALRWKYCQATHHWQWELRVQIVSILATLQRMGERQHSLQEWKMCLVNTVNVYWISRWLGSHISQSALGVLWQRTQPTTGSVPALVKHISTWMSLHKHN